MTGFTGIPADAVAFYADLEQHNSREWWARNKDRYEESVREPVLALTDALADEFGEAKLFRPHRDVRFSTDKSPLKTEQGAVVQGIEGMGYYLRVNADGLLAGGGSMHHASDQVTRMRAAVDDEESGEALADLVDALHDQHFQTGGEVLKTRPRGVAADHPRLELMRHKSLIAWRDHGTPDWLGTAAVVRHVREDWRAIRPLEQWFAAHVGPSTIPVRERRPGG
ncbi:MAG: DUF2461 domain-containing protein [Lapillicoccus sp.]